MDSRKIKKSYRKIVIGAKGGSKSFEYEVFDAVDGYIAFRKTKTTGYFFFARGETTEDIFRVCEKAHNLEFER